MPRRRSESVLSALGVSEEDERRYQQVLPLSGAAAGRGRRGAGRPGRAARRAAGRPDRPRASCSLDGGRLDVLPLAAGGRRGDRARGRGGGPDPRPARRPGRARSSSSARPAAGPGRARSRTLGRIDGEVSAGGNAAGPAHRADRVEQGRPAVPAARRLGDAARGRDLAGGRPGGRVGTPVPGDLPPRALHEAPEVLQARIGRGRGGAGHRRPCRPGCS